jgi:excisionase family DNA binding protein
LPKKGGSEMLSVTQAANIAEVNVATLRYAIKNGNLAATKVGNAWIITRDELERWLKSPKHQPNKGPRTKQ